MPIIITFCHFENLQNIYPDTTLFAILYRDQKLADTDMYHHIVTPIDHDTNIRFS